MDNLFISSGIPLKKLEKHFNVVPKNKFYCEVSDGEYTAIGVLNDEGNSDILTGFGLHNEEKLAFILKKFIKVFPVSHFINERDGYFEELFHTEVTDDFDFNKFRAPFIEKGDKYVSELINTYTK